MKKIKVTAFIALFINLLGMFLAFVRPFGIDIWYGLGIICVAYCLVIVVVCMVITFVNNHGGR